MATIGFAVEELKNGRRVARKGWNGKNMWLVLFEGSPAEGDFVFERLPYVAMKTADEKLVPWLCSQTDLLAEDWVDVTPTGEGS